MAGSGPLLWLLAAQLLRAGGKIEAHPRHHAARATGCARLLHLPDFVLSPYFAKGPGAAARGAGARCRSSRVDSVEARRQGQARARSCSAGAARAAHDGRSPAAAPGRGAERQSRDRGRRRASLERRASSASSRCSMPISAARCPASPWRATARASPAARRRPSAAGSPRIAAVRALQARARRCPTRRPCARRLQREEMGRAFLDCALPAGAERSAARGRHDRLPLRGSDGAAGARHGATRLRGAQPDEGLPALRHGAVPGPAVRAHRHRADRRRSAASTPAEVGYYRLRPPVKPITLAELASLPISRGRAQGGGALAMTRAPPTSSSSAAACTAARRRCIWRCAG